MAQPTIVICRFCAQTYEGEPGMRCPTGDGGVLVDYHRYQAMPGDGFMGRLVADKYAVIDKLGDGGMGSVYRALQQPVSRPVALKVIAPEQAVDGEQRGRFFREARVVSRLSDPAVVTLFDYGEDHDGTLFMVFELVDGELLSELMRREGRIQPERAVGWMQQILSALMEAHGEGLVHRDLKPENLMITRDGRGRELVKVLDFGIAKLLDQDPDGVHTREGIVLGTPRYMSPEQCQDKALDGRSDLYALGVMLWEMLAGRPPFDAASPLDILLAHVREPPPPLPADAAAPPGLAKAITRVLQKAPEQRFSDAAEMSEALQAAVADLFGESSGVSSAVRSRPVAKPRPAPPKARPQTGPRAAAPSGPVAPVGSGRRGLWIGVLAAVIGAGGVAGWLLTRQPPAPSAPTGPARISMGGEVVQPAEFNRRQVALAQALAKKGQLEDAELALQQALRTTGDRAGLLAAIQAEPSLAPLAPKLAPPAP